MELGVAQDEDAGGRFGPSELEKLADPAVKVVFLVNPSNPTSRALHAETAKFLHELVETRRRDLVIVTDDVYGTFVNGFRSLAAFLPRNTILVYSFSKYFGATGWRLGVIGIAEHNVLDEHPRFASLPTGASNFLRDFGLAVFVAIVGLKAGPEAIETVREYGSTSVSRWRRSSWSSTPPTTCSASAIPSSSWRLARARLGQLAPEGDPAGHGLPAGLGATLERRIPIHGQRFRDDVAARRRTSSKVTKKRRSARKSPRIVAHLDPDARNASLLDLLGRLARSRHADVLALRVLPELPWYARGRQARSIRHALESEAAIRLERDLEPLRSAGVGVRSRVVWGRPFQVIIEEALRRPTQLVATAARTEGQDALGAAAMDLFRKCPVPVLAVKARRARRIRRVLAAVDPAEPTPDEVDLNAEIVRAALEIATDEGAELHVCHAFSTLSELVLPEESREWVAEFRGRVQEALTRLVSPFGSALDDRRVHLLDGDASRVIPALIASKRIDLLVMGTIARGGIPGLLIGNTAERMLRSVDCSVLAIKPEGFVSPLRPGTPPSSRAPSASRSGARRADVSAGRRRRRRRPSRAAAGRGR